MSAFTQQRAKLLEASVLPAGKRPRLDATESAQRLAGHTTDRVFSYNAHALHSWLCPTLVLRGALCHVFSAATMIQGLAMLASALLIAIIMGGVHKAYLPCAHIYVRPWPPNNATVITIRSGVEPMQECAAFFRDMFAPAMLRTMEAQVGQLTRFVLGGFVALALARTYYINRSLLGTVFGKTLGLSMAVASCIKPQTVEQAKEVQAIRELLVRWANAAFLLMFLENDGLVSASGGSALLEGSLTQDEWEHVAALPSRCTYIYTWISSLVSDCASWGFVTPPVCVHLLAMVEELRGSNVWGLPSLPYPYSLLITFMVKCYLIIATCQVGYGLSFYLTTFMVQDMGTDAPPDHAMLGERIFCVIMELLYLPMINILYQGLLDVHSMLRNPNQDRHIGHLCTQKFLKFTSDVSHNLVLNMDTMPKWQRTSAEQWRRQPAFAARQSVAAGAAVVSFRNSVEEARRSVDVQDPRVPRVPTPPGDGVTLSGRSD